VRHPHLNICFATNCLCFLLFHHILFQSVIVFFVAYDYDFDTVKDSPHGNVCNLETISKSVFMNLQYVPILHIRQHIISTSCGV